MGGTRFNKIKNAVVVHKKISITIAIIILAAGYSIYRSLTTGGTVPGYTITRAQIGTISQTVTGTGQVSSAEQLDIASRVSGTIRSINVKVGDRVRTGSLVATIDSADAAYNLEDARLALAKLIQPPKTTDITNAKNILGKAYDDAFSAISTVFLDLPEIMSGMKDLLYGQGTFLSDQQSSYLISTARDYRDQTGRSYDRAYTEYQKVLETYKDMNRRSATSSIASLLSNTHSMAKDVAAALQNAQNTITSIAKVQPDYASADAEAAANNVSTWSNTINGDLADLLSSGNAIASSINTLSDLMEGADKLDIASQRLALAEQERNYMDYFIRAPFEGTIGRLPANKFDQASNGTVIATIIGTRKIASISLNEIDAARVRVGQKAEITFDAIDDFVATGTVSEVDMVGTVTQGVVTYGIKIAIDSDDSRIMPGMSVNVTVTTKRQPGALIIPSVAIKSRGGNNYIQVFDNPPAMNGQSRTVTFYPETAPREVEVTIGDYDDINTAITSGLRAGEWVVARTVTDASGQTATPNILNTLGGNRSTGGTFRTVR